MSLSSILPSYRDEYVPKASAFDPDIAELPDGVYDFEIVDYVFRAVNGKEICELTLRAGTSLQVRYTHWFNTQFGVNRFGADLLAFGFDVKTLEGLATVVKGLESGLLTLRGIRFHGKKKTDPNKTDPAKPYHSILVLSRLGAGSPPPSRGTSPPSEQVVDFPPVDDDMKNLF